MGVMRSSIMGRVTIKTKAPSTTTEVGLTTSNLGMKSTEPMILI